MTDLEIGLINQFNKPAGIHKNMPRTKVFRIKSNGSLNLSE